MTRYRVHSAFILLLVFWTMGASAQTTRTFAPYVDMSKMADRLLQIQAESGVQALTLAFVVSGSGCEPSWGGTAPIAADSKILAEITQLSAHGGDIIIAFGGYDGLELA